MKKISPVWKTLSCASPSLNKVSLKFQCLFLTLFLTLSVQLFAQQRTVSGKITSQNTPVAGATVQVKGSSTATQTDNEG